MYWYRAIVSYDGTDYAGWQTQQGKKTISQTMHDVFVKVFGVQVSLRAVSRTDAGVHARRQVVRVVTGLNIQPPKMRYAWNNSLPATITIRSLQSVPSYFNLHAGVQEKVYVYQFFTRRPSPFMVRYGWYVRRQVSIDILERALRLFVGTHDFKGFCDDKDRGSDTVRTIYDITVRPHPHCRYAYQVIVRGSKFLRYMVRRIVGAGMTAALRGESVMLDIAESLENKKSCPTLINAPACGLFLQQVVYHKSIKEQLYEF